jgi:hypothetical protein
LRKDEGHDPFPFRLGERFKFQVYDLAEFRDPDDAGNKDTRRLAPPPPKSRRMDSWGTSREAAGLTKTGRNSFLLKYFRRG